MAKVIMESKHWRIKTVYGQDNMLEIVLTSEVDGYNKHPSMNITKEEFQELLSFHNIPLEALGV